MKVIMVNLEKVKDVIMGIFILIILHIMAFLKMIYLKDKIHFKGQYSYCCIWKNRLRHRFGFYLTSDGTTFCGEFNHGNINGNRYFK